MTWNTRKTMLACGAAMVPLAMMLATPAAAQQVPTPGAQDA
jgi:hypothetical protein